MAINTAIIGGTGVYDPKIFSSVREEKIKTPYGIVKVMIGDYLGNEIAFMARHGDKHQVPPHLVNYRGNIAGLKQLGVKNIIATAAVGSLNMEMAPGNLVFVDQFLDFTKGRVSTFVEDGVVHVDMTKPYCCRLRELLTENAVNLGSKFNSKGTYVCTEGPRFETAAEIKMFRHFGGDLVGMTSVPEVVLSREAGICYATIAIVTNYAAGITSDKLSHQEVLEMMANSSDKVRSLLVKTISGLNNEINCSCCNHEEKLNPAD